MERESLTFVPQWEGSIEGWTINYINKNLWRVQPEHDIDDLYQDGYMFFLECKRRYPQVIDPPHFMRLYQTCLRNHITDLAWKRTQRAEVGSVAEDGTNLLDENNPDVKGMNWFEYAVLIADAPPVVAKAVRRLTESTKRQLYCRRPGGLRETRNELLCRLGGVDPRKVDLVTMVKDWLCPTESQRASTSTSPTT